MMGRPIEQIATLTIGTVESVSPSEIKVLLEPNAPQATALNTGVPTGFPRINSYLLIPNATGAVVGIIVWLGIERSTFPKRTGLKDFGLVDLPFPLRKISLTPLGTLVTRRDAESGQNTYQLERGVSAFPSVGDAVQLPTAEQLKCIIESSKDVDKRVKIGTSPLAANADVTVDPDKIFGRHLAVLGNTGSGKSCTVAGLIRWSIQAAEHARKKAKKPPIPNARFIILDPNGEYSKAFSDLPMVRVFRVSPTRQRENSLVLPVWMWNSHEWCAFTEAKSGVQRPILMRALRELRTTSKGSFHDKKTVFHALLKSFYRSIVSDRSKGATAYMDKPGKNDFGQKLHAMAQCLNYYAKDEILSCYSDILKKTASKIKEIADMKYKTFINEQGETVEYYQAFTPENVDRVIDALDRCIESIPGGEQNLGINEDSPIKFDPNDFIEYIEQIAVEQGQSQHVDTLILRIKMLLSDMRLYPILCPPSDVDLEGWLTNFIGDDGAKNGTLGIIDLSLISSDVLHLMIAVVARIAFEATQRYHKMNDKELPTVLILEEAHTFVKRGSDEDGTPTASQMCRQIFEQIAREGRKFGLGLVLSSQRPSELSPTVLAQCNTFILHRIVNDRDQELVAKLVPDTLGGLLKELPSLPSRQAILLGWAAPVPTLVEITELPEEQRPRSQDPKFWDVWTGVEKRDISWDKIVAEWTNIRTEKEAAAAAEIKECKKLDEKV